jgi:hypothetical protein
VVTRRNIQIDFELESLIQKFLNELRGLRFCA